MRAAKETAVPGARGAAGGVADPASHARADLRAMRPKRHALPLKARLFPASSPKKANRKKTIPRSSQARRALINRRAASDAPVGAGVVADAAGVAGWRMALPDQSLMS